jgi:hypothetical protein
MSVEMRERFYELASELQEAYMTFYRDRLERKAAHRDTLEAFAAGWSSRGRLPRQHRSRV